ncbi:uncharacterized protein LOC118456151 [Anopheles albimanus]|uniref:uncharacterized protein LOC118456151 n=1 Tax=Anopheles albimanus TaxID=7167 RepID=UPI0016418ECF|nr:uncharacterized protein LOC118456151 [Anopheles albimanus]
MEVVNEEVLAELVRKYPFLYDTRSVHYKDNMKKAEAWEAIGNEMGIPSTAAKNKWRSLRDKYNRIKRQTIGKTGQAATKINRMDFLAFVESCSNPRPTSSNISSQENDDSNATIQFGDHTTDITTDITTDTTAETCTEPTTDIIVDTTAATVSSNSTLLHRTVRRKAAVHEPVDKVIKYLDSKKPQDGLDMMFAGFAKCIRKLKKENQTKILVEIVKLIGNAEVEEERDKENS